MKRSCRIFSIILGLLLCISLLTGCSTNKDPNAPKHTRDNGRKLTIYCTEDDPYQKRLIDNYNAQADEKDQIEIQSYGAASDISDEGSGDAQTQLATEILSGGGPDLFLIDPFNMIYNLQSTVSKGAFQNLDYYFNKYPMDWGQYNSSIMEYGIYQGKRYLIPYMYEPEIYISTVETLEKYGIPQDVNIVHDRLSELLPYQKKAEQGGENLFNLPPAIEYRFNDFIDYEHKTHSYDSEEFKQTAEIYKAFSSKKSDGKNCIFKNMLGMGRPEYITNLQEIINTEDPVIILGGKQTNSGNYLSTPESSLAINANSPNGERAFKFIQWVLSETTQADQFKVNFTPVHKQALQTRIQAATPLGSQAQEGIAQYQELLNNDFDIQTYLDMKFYEEILYPLWKNYRDDKITVEEFSKQLSDKTDIYLQEL